jgi:hypothetical protein
VCLGAAKQAKPFGPQPLSASTGTFYPIPGELRSQFRELQYENQKLQIDNQQLLDLIEQNLDRHRDLELLARIEQNLERQRDLMDAMKSMIYGYAVEKRIDITKFTFDGNEVRFTEKKAQ